MIGIKLSIEINFVARHNILRYVFLEISYGKMADMSVDDKGNLSCVNSIKLQILQIFRYISEH